MDLYSYWNFSGPLQEKKMKNEMRVASPVSFMCKIILDSEQLPSSNKQWTRAKRCTLTIPAGGLQFKDIFIPFEDIEKATLHIYQSALFFEYAVLSITSGGKTHHFGIKYSEYWKGDLPFSVERVQEETPYLLFRRALMVIILAYIIMEIIRTIQTP
jgi:hypothetical protein